jgi:capsid assembly protease
MILRHLPRISAALHTEPWLIRREKHLSLSNQLRAATNHRGQFMDDEDDDDDDDKYKAALQQQADMDCLTNIDIIRGVAVLPVSGIIGKHLDRLDMMCGGYDLMTLQAQAMALQNRADVHAVVLWLNTPGGRVQGIADAAQVLRDLAATKRLIAYCDEACSCGQWLACACDEIYCGQTSMMGCVGAICTILDESRAFELEGLKMEVFTDGIHKGAGVEGTSLSAAQRLEIQARIDHIGGMFKDFIRSRRPSVPEEAMQGQWFYGDTAVELGFADAIAPTLDHVIAHAMS